MFTGCSFIPFQVSDKDSIHFSNDKPLPICNTGFDPIFRMHIYAWSYIFLNKTLENRLYQTTEKYLYLSLWGNHLDEQINTKIVEICLFAQVNVCPRIQFTNKSQI